MKLYSDEEAMRAEVLRYVAPGTPVEEARKTMEAHGFKCSFERDFWNELKPESSKDEIFLICSRHMPQEKWWRIFDPDEEIRVFFSFQEGIVTAVRINRILTCL
jgi:hypothetical protein